MTLWLESRADQTVLLTSSHSDTAARLSGCCVFALGVGGFRSVGQTKHVRWASTTSGFGTAADTESQDQLISLILVWRQQTANKVWSLFCSSASKQIVRRFMDGATFINILYCNIYWQSRVHSREDSNNNFLSALRVHFLYCLIRKRDIAFVVECTKTSLRFCVVARWSSRFTDIWRHLFWWRFFTGGTSEVNSAVLVSASMSSKNSYCNSTEPLKPTQTHQ